MLKREAVESITNARRVAGAVFDLVSDLVTMNQMAPLSALDLIYNSEVYTKLWSEEVWTYPHWAIYEMLCREKQIKSYYPLKQWDYPEIDTMEFVCEVFEIYRFLSLGFVAGHVLHNLFTEQHIYKYLSNYYKEEKNNLKDSPKELLPKYKTETVDMALRIECVLQKKTNLPEKFHLKSFKEETDLERFYFLATKNE